MDDENPEYNSVWLGKVSTEDASGYYPVIGAIETLATATFPPKQTIGDYTKDAEDYLSTLILSDLSGGMNVEDMNEGSDTARCWTAFADIRRPGKIAPNPRVEVITPPAGAPTGTAWSCGQIADTPYFLIGGASAMVAYGRKESDSTWYTGVALNPDIVPVGKPVAFANRLFVPCGTSGYLIISEADSVGAPGVPTLTNVTTGAIGFPASYTAGTPDVNPPTAIAFCVFDQKLYALSASGGIAWSFTGSDDTWTWPYDEARAWYPHLQAGEDPQNIIGFYNPNGDPHPIVISDRGAYIWSEATPPSLVNTPIQFPPHPDFGGAAVVWRAGEDLHIAAGLDEVRYTSANVVVPLSGLARDDGVPQELFGSILDLEAETSEMYALVGPVTNGASGYVYNDQVGSAGTGNGEFADVRGIAVNSAGSVFACDENNERVQEFDSALTYVAQFGSAGTGNGQFASNNGPYDIAFDSADAAFVVDRGNSRVQKFSAANAYVSQFGTFDDGTDAVAADEDWALTDTFGSTGTGNDNFDTPGQVAVDATHAYIADTANNRLIKRLLSTGAYVAQITGLTGITGVAVDPSGNIHVCYLDAGRGRVRKYNSSLVLQWTTATISQDGTDVTYRHLASYASGTFATSVSHNRFYSIDTGGGILTPGYGTAGSGNGQFNAPYGIATDGTYVYVVDAGNSRVQKFDVAGTYVAQFPVPASCRGCALDDNGNLYVANFANDLVNRYSGDGTLLSTFAQADADGIAVDANDTTVWVTNATSDNLTEWELTLIGAVPSAPPADGSFNLPEGIAIKTASGRIYVTDTANHRVQYFTSAGAFEGKFGSSAYSASTGAITAGTANGEFNTPTGIAVNQTSGNVYVVDSANDRVQEFTATGTFVRAIGTSGLGDGQFTTPTAIAVHPTLFTVYVADSTRDDVQIFNSSGTFILKIGSTGTGNGQFSLPIGIAFDATGAALYVSDLTDERIQKFAFSSATSGQTYPWLAAWHGIGWYGKWRGGAVGISPNHMHVTATAHAYSLYWGLEDGTIYRTKLRRYFHNPRRAFLSGEDDFEETFEIITSRFDAAMLGFWKLASHMVIFMENATSTENITIEYMTDADTSWVSLGTVDSTDKTYLPFGMEDGFSKGVPFNWISFRIRGTRGADVTKAAIIKSMVVAFMKLPQNTNAFTFLVPFPKEEYGNRTGFEIRRDLNELVTSREMLILRFPDQNGNERSHRGYLTALSGDDAPSGSTDGKRAVHFIELMAEES